MPVAISAVPVITIVIAVDAVSTVMLFSYANICLYLLVLSAIKLKLILPLLLSKNIWLLVVNKV